MAYAKWSTDLRVNNNIWIICCQNERKEEQICTSSSRDINSIKSMQDTYNDSRQTNSFLEVKLRHLRRRICDKKQWRRECGQTSSAGIIWKFLGQVTWASHAFKGRFNEFKFVISY